MSLKRPITFTLPPEVVEYLDQKAKEEWLSRSSYLTRMLGKIIDDEMKEGKH